MKSVYTGDEKVAEFESYDELRVGENKPAFIYEGSELVYPNPVKDGLVLWYDFSGRTNTDGQRGIAEDLSGNGNHGTLQNFNYTSESGYDKNKLLFDGVDDYVGETVNRIIELDVFKDSLAFTVKVKENKRNNLLYAQEDLKIDLWGGSIRRSDMSPSIKAERNILNEVVSVYMVRDGVRHLTYINGVVVDDVAYTNSKPLRFSNIGNYVPAGRPNVELYDVKIYNRPLTPSEVAHNYAIEKERFGIE